MGVSTIDFIYQGDAYDLRAGSVVAVVGYFVGTNDTQNKLGGPVESLVLVGHKILAAQ